MRSYVDISVQDGAKLVVDGRGSLETGDGGRGSFVIRPGIVQLVIAGGGGGGGSGPANYLVMSTGGCLTSGNGGRGQGADDPESGIGRHNVVARPVHSPSGRDRGADPMG